MRLMQPPDLVQPGHPTPKPDCRPPCPAGMGLGQVDPFHSLGCGRGKNLACWSPLRKAQPSLSVPSAAPCLMPFGGPSAPGRTGFQGSGLGRGCTFPRGKSHPAPTLPGPSYQGCPPNPRPRMFNLQIYFHHKAAGFESLSLKSKQNTKALPKSLEREGLPAPAVLPRRGAALGQAAAFCVSQRFPELSFSALQNPASGLCSPAVYTDSVLWVASYPAGLGSLPLDWDCVGTAGAEGHFATWWGRLSPLLIQQIFIESL